MGLDREGLGELTIPQDLQFVEPARDETLLAEELLGDLGVGVEALEGADREDHHLGGEGVPEAALGETTLERGLAAVEVQLVDVALRASLLALLPAPAGLAEARADAATDAALGRVGAEGRLELGEDVGHVP